MALPARFPLRAAGIAAAVLSLPLLTAAADATAKKPSPRDTTKGFVVTWFGMATHEGEKDCPDGPAVIPDLNGRIKQMPASKRAYFESAQGKNELQQIMQKRGPLGETACEHPETVADPPLRTVQGDRAYGLNLDGVGSGTKTPNSCAHQNFAHGLNGEGDVDNQLYRVSGCMFAYRDQTPGGPITVFFNGVMRAGNYTILIELTGVDDPLNDEWVEVGIYSGADPMVQNASGNGFLPGASLEVVDEKKFHTRTRGKIVKGVLTTEPADTLLKIRGGEVGGTAGYLWQGGRLRLELQPDGSAKGVMAGYLDYRHFFHARSPAGTFGETSQGSTCPAWYAGMRKAADGYPDPETGACTALSAAYIIEAVPAFVIHPGQQTTAAAPAGR